MRTVLGYRSDLLPPSETFIKEQMLAYRSWRAILVGRRMSHQLPLDGLDIRLLDDERQNGLGQCGLGQLLARARWHLGAPPQLQSLRCETPALVHAHFGLDALEARSIARSLGIPLVVTLHGYDINIHREWWENGDGGPQMIRYPRRLLKLATAPGVHFITVSDALRRRAIAFGIPAEKLTTRYVGIDLRKFAPGPTPITARRRRVLFVGRLVEKKGCGYLIHAMQIVTAQVPEAELTIVGEGPMRSDLEQLASALRVPVSFLGALPPASVKTELDRARVFCLPSVHAANGDAEGFGIVLLEAQAAGLPVVTSAFGGAEEGLLDGRTGYRVAEKDIAGLSSRLVRILNDDDTAMMMSSQTRAFVASHFDLSVLTRGLEAYYDEIASVASMKR
jgi:glycosyltransferase involved in cell wall biosynthesis